MKAALSFEAGLDKHAPRPLSLDAAVADADGFDADAFDVNAVRSHFDFPSTPRIATNNAASTQPPRELLNLHNVLAAQYENVHPGQSNASMHTTQLFETACDNIASFIGAPSRKNIVVVRNTTEAHNAVMYSVMADFRDGDNVVSTTLEHNSNFVTWFAMCNDILPKFGHRVELRLARLDPATGVLDMAHLGSLIDSRTKLVCCTAASTVGEVDRAVDAVAALVAVVGSGRAVPLLPFAASNSSQPLSTGSLS